MKHVQPDVITKDATPIAKPKPEIKVLSRKEKLELWATIIEDYGIEEKKKYNLRGPAGVRMFHGIEHMERPRLRSQERDDTPTALAFGNPTLREAGLAGAAIGHAMDFFDLTENEVHTIMCDCAHSSATDEVAKRIRGVGETGFVRRKIANFFFKKFGH